jgi:hypothetical protein
VKINIYASKTGKWIKRGAAIAVCAGLGGLLGSCGGSGVSSETGTQVGALTLLPSTGTLYANVPFTFTIAGGRAPYVFSSNEQTLVASQTVNSNTFVVTPNNPGVVDVGQDPNEVPSRTIQFSVRDNAGTTISSGASSYKVLQNFLTGYGLSVSALFSCSTDSTGAAISAQACVGSESAIDLRPTTSGVLYRNRALRFTINYGQFLFIDKNSNPPNQAVSSITLTTSGATAAGGTESGSLRAFLRPLDNAGTQYAGLRITDVVSGIYRDVDFLIQTPAVGPLKALPTAIGPIIGRDTSVCGAGSVDVLLTGGKPPYSIRTSIGVTAPAQLANPGIFTVNVNFGSPPNCINEPNGVTITDSAGQTISISVTTQVGTAAPVTPLNVFPTNLCLQDGGTATVAVTGGNALKVITSLNPSLVSVTPSTLSSGSGTGGGAAAPSSVTVTAVGAAPATPVAGTPTIVRVADGASAIDVTVTRKTSCP